MKSKQQISSGFSSQESNSEQHTRDHDESGDSLNQPEDYSPPVDLSSALRSVALMRILDLKEIHSPMPKLFSTPGLQEDDSTLSPLDDQDQINEGDAVSLEEEIPNVSFKSKYIQIFPLYQDYSLQEVKENRHRLGQSSVSDLITPECLQSLPSRLRPDCQTRTTSLQLRPPDGTSSSPPTSTYQE